MPVVHRFRTGCPQGLDEIVEGTPGLTDPTPLRHGPVQRVVVERARGPGPFDHLRCQVPGKEVRFNPGPALVLAAAQVHGHVPEGERAGR
jgi:hypothetical protein